jgi:hypothetical protein
MKYITKKNGSTFPSRPSAISRAKFLGLKEGDYEVKASEGGYVLAVSDELHEKITAKITEKCDRSMPKVKEPEKVLDNTDKAAEAICEPITTKAEVSMEEFNQTVELTGNWKPAKLLSLIDKYRKPGRRYKWVNTTIDGNVEKKRSEGWVVDKEIYKDMKHLSEYKDNSTSLDTTTRIRELMLMWIPEKMAVQRNKHYRDLGNKRLTQSKDRLGGELQEGGGGVYGSLNVQRSR